MKLRLANIHKAYGPHTALNGLDFAIESTQSLTLVGPSGGGKSTALRLIAGLEYPDSGEVLVNDTPLPHSEEGLRAYRKTIGVVFQSYNLFPHLDAITNIALPLQKVHGFTAKQARARADELLERFQLSPHHGKKPSELSGGQNQRVAIARSIAHDPSLILFDEPTSALDPEMSGEVLDVIEELIRSGKDCILVTHQMGFARRASEHAAFLSEGRVAEHGPSDSFFQNPKDPALQRFLERELRY